MSYFPGFKFITFWGISCHKGNFTFEISMQWQIFFQVPIMTYYQHFTAKFRYTKHISVKNCSKFRRRGIFRNLGLIHFRQATQFSNFRNIISYKLSGESYLLAELEIQLI
jgi:hypothetical protein